MMRRIVTLLMVFAFFGFSLPSSTAFSITRKPGEGVPKHSPAVTSNEGTEASKILLPVVALKLPDPTQYLGIPANEVVSIAYGDKKGSLFQWQYFTGAELVALWSKKGLNGHKVYVQLTHYHDHELEWRVSGWKSFIDGGLAQGSVNKDGLRILTDLPSRYVMVLEGTGSERKHAYYAARPPEDADYARYAQEGIHFYEVSGRYLRRLDDHAIVYRLNFTGPMLQ